MGSVKSNVVVAVISLACLVAFLHPCHGLICYMCYSRDYANPLCEKISGNVTEFDYETDAEYCLKVVFHKKYANGTEERLLVRRGLAPEGYSEVSNVIGEYRARGFEVDYFKCQEDRCNGH